MTYQPRPRIYRVRIHDGKTSRTEQCTAYARKDVYEKYRGCKLLAVEFVRWADETEGNG